MRRPALLSGALRVPPGPGQIIGPLRLAALRALSRIEERGTSKAVIPLLGDRDREVATWAAFALGLGFVSAIAIGFVRLEYRPFIYFQF